MENPCYTSPDSKHQDFSAPVKLDIRKGLAWDQRTDVILGLWLRRLFSKRRWCWNDFPYPKNTKTSLRKLRIQCLPAFPGTFKARGVLGGEASEPAFTTLRFASLLFTFSGFSGGSASSSSSWSGPGTWQSPWLLGKKLDSTCFLVIKSCQVELSNFVDEGPVSKTHIVVGSKIIRMWGQGVIQVGNARNCFCHRNHAWNKSKGMCWNGKLWWFLDVFFQVWTKLSSSGDTKTHKLPTTCTLSRLLPERSRSVTSHHARNFTNCSASQSSLQIRTTSQGFFQEPPNSETYTISYSYWSSFWEWGSHYWGVPGKIPCNLPNKLRVDAAIYTSEFFYQNSAFARPDMRRFGSQNASVLSLEPQDCKQGLDLNTQTTRQVTKQRTKMQIENKKPWKLLTESEWCI